MPPSRPPPTPSLPTLLHVLRPSTTTSDTLSSSSSSTASRRRRRQPVQLVAPTTKGGMLLGVPYVRLQHPQHDIPPSIPDDADSLESNSEVEEERLAARAARSDPSHSTRTMTQEVALLSTPGTDPYDEQAIRHLQLHFCLLALLSVVVQGVLLYHPSQMDPSLVLDSPSIQAGNDTNPKKWTPLPGPFDRISPSVRQAYVPLYVLSVLLALLGVVSATARAPVGLKVYSLVAFLYLFPAVLFAPYVLYVPTLVPTAMMVYVAEELGVRLVPSWLLVLGTWRRF